tara:strand:+ start:830 stop:1705 length:876 start_codon:yes stop_codon:yes gene_type:complete
MVRALIRTIVIMAKRQRTREWEATCTTVAALTGIVQSVANLSTTVSFTIEVSDTTSGAGKLTTQVVSTTKSCMVSAAIVCDTAHAAGDGAAAMFCVNAKTLLRVLKFVDSESSVVITKGDDDHITVKAIHNETRKPHMTWSLPLIVHDEYRVELDPLEYTAEWLYNVKTLRQDLQHCREIDSGDTVELSLLQHEGKNHCVELHSMGDTGSVRICRGPEIEGSHPLPEEQVDNLCAVYRQKYSIGSIYDFLRCVEGQNVTLKLGDEQPLVLESPLVGDGSYLTFVQGPQAGM